MTDLIVEGKRQAKTGVDMTHKALQKMKILLAEFLHRILIEMLKINHTQFRHQVSYVELDTLTTRSQCRGCWQTVMWFHRD